MKTKLIGILIFGFSFVYSQEILTLSPNEGARGSVDLHVTLVASGVNFSDEYSSPYQISFSGGGVHASDLLVTSDSTVDFLLNIYNSAPPGMRDVSLYYDYQWIFKQEGFLVLGEPYEIVSVTPNEGLQGSVDLQVKLVASGINFYDEYTTLYYAGVYGQYIYTSGSQVASDSTIDFGN